MALTRHRATSGALLIKFFQYRASQVNLSRQRKKPPPHRGDGQIA
jgi:hypothetical protein